MADLSIFDKPGIAPEELKGITGDLQDPNVNAAASLNGLNADQRFIVQNFFDTQPKRRAAYFRRLGYEMNPKNNDEYKPIGANTNWVNVENLEESVEVPFPVIGSIYLPATFNEAFADAKDVVVDTLEGIATGAAATSAAAAGITGGPVGSALAAGAAAGATKAGVEGIKTAVGDLFLDEDVPVDLANTFYQSLTVGALMGMGTAGSSVVKQWKKLKAEKLSDTLKTAAIQKSGGRFNQNLVNDLAKDPEKYTPENVKGATDKLLELQDELFGTSMDNPHTTKQLTGGLAKDTIVPLNKKFDLEVEKLANTPEANFSVDELVGEIKSMTRPITSKKFKTASEEKVLNFFDGQIDKLRSFDKTTKASSLVDTKGNPLIPETTEALKEINFKEGRDILKSWQNAAYEEGPLKGNFDLVKATSKLKNKANQKAAIHGSDLGELNKKRSDILRLYKDSQRTLKDGSFQNAFVGEENLSKLKIQRMFERVDETLNTDLASRVEDGQFKSAVERMYKNPKAFGSGSVIKDAMEGGLTQARSDAVKFATVGGAAGGFETAGKAGAVGAATGFVRGARQGAATSSPQSLIKQFKKAKSRLDNLDSGTTFDDFLQSKGISAPAQAGAQLDTLPQDIMQEFQATQPQAQAQAAPVQQPQQQLPEQFNAGVPTTPTGGGEPAQDPLSIFDNVELSDEERARLGL